ncbi:hypothetical protein P3S67_012736 [Capsicum chacoense]
MRPNRILLVSIHHVLYPITVDVLHQVFPPHGVVEKIVTFQKSAGFQALIQYQLLQTAISSRSSLQGRYIYDGCCQLDIQFSNLDELQVKYNNERLRDYTNPNLPAEQKGKSPQQGYGDSGAMYSVQGSGPRGGMGNAAAIAAAFSSGLPPGISGANDRCTVLLVSDVDPDRIDEDKLFNLFSLYGNIVRIKILRNKPDHALVQMGDGFQAELAVHFLKNLMSHKVKFTCGGPGENLVNETISHCLIAVFSDELNTLNLQHQIVNNRTIMEIIYLPKEDKLGETMQH